MILLLRKFCSIAIYVALLSFLLLFLFGCTPSTEAPQVIDGFVDLSSWNFDRNGPVRLFGDWKFFWSSSGEDVDDSITDYYRVPGLWGGVSAGGQPLDSKGNAIYTVRLRMPDVHPDKMAILVAGGMSVCEIWINGTKMKSSGQLGTSAATEEPQGHYVIAECPEAWRLMEISLHISNHHNIQGGLNGDVILGSTRQINNFYSIPRLLGAYMAGALCCLSLLYLTLFFLCRTGAESLYFGLFCLFWCAAMLFSPSSGFLMTILVPSIPWEWYINCSMLPYGATVPLMLMFYHRLFPKRSRVVMERLYWAFGVLYVMYILGTPPNAYDTVVFFYFLGSSLALIYMFICFAIDIYHREKGVWILGIGYFALGLTELEDILFDMNIIEVASLRPFGIFVFILSYAVYLAYRFSRAFNRAENLAGELEAANVRLLQLDRLKDEFLANTTHELKTPLAGMVGIAEALLVKSENLPEKAVNHLKTIVHSGQRLSKLINDVLDFSRLKHKDIELNKESVRLGDKVQRIMALAGALKSSDEVLLINDIPAGFPPVLADPDRLEQILFNLVGNSVKFTEAGRISVSAELRGDEALISVTDTGMGIPAEDLQRIFMPYEQGGLTGSGGCGIGLPITKQLVEMHGGTLEVLSEPLAGSAFSFALPVADIDENQGLVSVPEPHAMPAQPVLSFPMGLEADNGRYQVLIVDDEPVNLQVVASIFDLVGISFRTASNGKAALRMIEDGDEPEMVLLDVMMPDMNGYQVCRELRRRFTASVLPIVLLTVKNRVGDIVEGFAVGANDYLTKPFSREELSARVLSQLKLKEAYTALAENVELKHELEMRRKTESHLRFLHARLGMVFDSLEDAIVVVNQSCEIVFYNASLKEFFGNAFEELLGLPLERLLSDSSVKSSLKMLDYCCGKLVDTDQSALFEDVNVRAGDKTLSVSFWATRVELEEETLSLLILRVAKEERKDDSLPLLATIVQNLNANRERILALENVMLSVDSSDLEKPQQLVDDIESLDNLLGKIDSRVRGQLKEEQRRSLAVKVMNMSMDCWVDETGMTKADMADQSGLWNVYMERDGYFRTQTLDKYLDIETFPQKPRWKMIFVTADYVLANCKTDSLMRRELEIALTDLRGLIFG